MTKFRSSFVVGFDIQEVWKFYTSVDHLAMITPKKMDLKVLECTDRVFQQGTELWLSAKAITVAHWHSKITYLKPYEYVDQMVSGRFKVWKHHHKFMKHENTTEIIDMIDLELGYGLLGKLLERYAVKELERIFKYREKATVDSLRYLSTNPAR